MKTGRNFALLGFALTLPLAVISLEGCGAGPGGTPPPSNIHTLPLNASATLTSSEAAQPENIFVYSFPIPAGNQLFLGLKGDISQTSQAAVFNESLITVATNIAGPCPVSGKVYPNYTVIFNTYPNLLPVQNFIQKSPVAGTTQLPIDYTMPVGVPVSNCMVVILDWEGSSPVTMTSNLTMLYTAASDSTAGTLLSTNQEFVFGDNEGAGSTDDDSLSFALVNPIPQNGTILGFVGDISDSSYFVAPPPGKWQTTNDLYLVPGGCPASIPVNPQGWTNDGGHYYADIPKNAQHLFSRPLSGDRAQAVQQFVNQPANVKVQKGDCLVTLFGLNSPGGGGIDSENQVQTIFLPAP